MDPDRRIRQWRGVPQHLGLRASVYPWLLAVAISCLGMVLWLPYRTLTLHIDTAGYATVAYWWSQGDILYRDLTVTRPQGIFVIFRLLDAIGLDAPEEIHLAAAVWWAVCTLVLFATVQRIWGLFIALGTIALFILLGAVPAFEGFTANAELFMLLPLLGSLYCLVRADAIRPGGLHACIWLFGSGFLGAIALLIKPAALGGVILGFAWLSWRWFTGTVGNGDFVRSLSGFLLGFSCGILPAIAHGFSTAQAQYFRHVLFYRLGQDSLLSTPIEYQLFFLGHNSLYVLARAPILLFVAVGLFQHERMFPRAHVLLLLWCATALLGVALGGNWFVHYYLQLLPPFAVAIMIGLVSVFRAPRQRVKVALQGLALVGLLAFVPVLSSCTALVNGTRTAQATAAEPDGTDLLPPAHRDVRAVSAYIREHSSQRDTIYVAYQEPAVYYLARRRPAARWLYLRELTRVPGAFDEQVARIADPATAPRYIVGAQAFDRWGLDPDGTLRAIVARDYHLETTIDGLPLYRRAVGP